MKFSCLLLAAFILHTGTTHDCVTINGTTDFDNQNLTCIPQDLPIDIESLDLSENNLGVILNKSFARYGNLKKLEIDNSYIHTVQPEGFNGLNSLENVSLAGNTLNISTDGLFILTNIRNIINLDFSSNMNSSDKRGYLFYPDEVFQLLIKLRNLSIDLYGHPVFGPGFKYLKLNSIRFKSCCITALQNKTFVNLPDSVTELHLTECKFIENKDIEINLLFPFSKMSIFSFSDAIILTAGTTQYLKAICVKTLALADNDIVDILPYSFFYLDWKHLSCLEHLDLSGNRFGFSTIGIQMLTVGQKLSNLKIFDFSYIPLKYKSANYLPVINYFKPNQLRVKREDESCSDAVIGPLDISIPPRLEFVRITHSWCTTSNEIESEEYCWLTIS
ncbi:unnamed protein product [Mytilus coruscus]|uniref:LINGO n=1 Tax=Mytilus coruscus TaxID=42192 RepID=A0A6J8D7K9_MYTCO|nr:unnamed protein product [Mytilus coruscus]